LLYRTFGKFPIQDVWEVSCTGRLGSFLYRTFGKFPVQDVWEVSYTGRLGSFLYRTFGKFPIQDVWEVSYTGRLGSFLYRTFGKFPIRPSLRQNNSRKQRRAYLLEPPGFIHLFIRTFIHSPIHSFRSVVRHVHSFFQSEFSTECDVVLSLSITSTLFASLRSSNSCLRLLPRLPVLSFFPSITCCRWHFICKMLPIQLSLLHFIVSVIFLSSSTLM